MIEKKEGSCLESRRHHVVIWKWCSFLGGVGAEEASNPTVPWKVALPCRYPLFFRTAVQRPLCYWEIPLNSLQLLQFDFLKKRLEFELFSEYGALSQLVNGK